MEKKKLINLIIILVLCQYAPLAFSQQQSLPLNYEHRLNYEKHLYKTPKNKPFHTAVKPYLESEVYEEIYPDSTYGLEKLAPTNGFKKTLDLLGYDEWVRFDENGFIKPTEFIIEDGDTIEVARTENHYKKRKFYIAINPVIHFEYGRGNNDNKTSFNVRGIEFKANIGRKVSIYSAFLENQARFPDYISAYVRKTRTAPGEGKVRNFKSDGFDFSRAMGHINYAPNKYFNVELGNGKHFIGDGYRSLLLSDNAFVYPYIKFSTQFWKIKYVNIYSELINNVQNTTDFTLGFPRKLANFNYLSLAATPWLSIGAFEGLIWRSTLPNGKRKFDANFLNPIIGVRALQKNLDANKIYGINASINLPKYIVLYGQIMINQFSTDIKSIENRSGIQLGAKYYDAFGVKNLNLLAEFNTVRPYAYQEKTDTVLHYSHYNQALAHPLGSGFREFIFLVNYRYKRLVTELKLSMANTSIDGPALNVGTDIMLATNQAAYPTDPEIGQGLLAYKVMDGEFMIGYVLNPKLNMILQAKLHIRNYKMESTLPAIASPNLKMFSVGINTDLFNHYYDVPIHF